MDLQHLQDTLEKITESAKSTLSEILDLDALIQEKNRFLGKKGEVQAVMQHLRNLPHQDKRTLGQASNAAKSQIEAYFESQLELIKTRLLQEKLKSQAIDVSLPPKSFRKSHGHPLKQVENELFQLFSSLGFSIAQGPEIETDFFNFEALNFPPDHPARDAQDTFLTTDHHLLRTHTSPVQIRTLLHYNPPIRIIAPGRVYRCDNDVTHSPVFHQIEGLFVDTHVTYKDLKGTLEAFIHQYFGPDTKIRLRSSYFPFTEPSAEVDISCVFCQQKGCRICSYTGWLEILGSGMVHPNVLKASGLDPERYSGFAFGLGIERIAMLKYAIPDIRFFYDGNIEFLSQF